MSRSFHFIPGHKTAFIERIPTLKADHVVLELEDGVGDGDKESARSNIEKFLAEEDPADFYLRVNAFDSKHWLKDSELLARLPRLPGLVIPKVESAEELKKMIGLLENMGSEVRVIPLMESFSSLVAMKTITDLPQVIGLGIGMEDLLADTVHDQSELQKLVSQIKLEVVLAARAAGIQAIDTISTTIRDQEKFREECIDSRSHGFHGRFLIHPGQIAVANEIFGPDAKMISWAEEVIRLSGGDESSGYQTHEGKVISGPMVLKAKTILRHQ